MRALVERHDVPLARARAGVAVNAGIIRLEEEPRRHAEHMRGPDIDHAAVTGDHDAIYGIADDYFSVAKEDPNTPGGFDHSGRLILVDKNRHVRSFCDGTDAEDVDRFMKDISKLLAEEFK